MELEQIFYTIAAFFGIAAVIYFAWEYLDVLPRITKAFMLFLLAVLLFVVGGSLRQVGR